MSKARLWIEYCSDNEWGNRTMEDLAVGRFNQDPTLDIVTVVEHAGWSLSWTRDGLIVGTANDMAQLRPEAIAFLKAHPDRELVGYCRRSDDGEHNLQRYDNYFPCLAVA